MHATKRSDKSVLDGIINSDAIPESDKTVDRLTQEARTLVGAGSETTGISLETITYHVLASPEVLRRLKQELAQAAAAAAAGASKGDAALSDYATIKRLPYLTAVINEGLRLSNSVSGRLARVDRRNVWVYTPNSHNDNNQVTSEKDAADSINDNKNDKSPAIQDPQNTLTSSKEKDTDQDISYPLPPGTVISMAIRANHTAATIYPDPLSFKPDRWLVEGDELKRLEKYFVPFGRGGRSCIGKELALMNLYLTVANFFHRFDADLFRTDRKDIEMEHDFFSPFPRLESKGLRVVLK